MNGSIVMRVFAAAVLVAGALVPGVPVRAAEGGDVTALLQASRAALGLDALPKLRTLHLHGTTTVVGITGTADSWQDVRDGRCSQFADAGPVSGAQGWDGTRFWNRDASGVVWNDGGEGALYAARDAVYLNRYLLWAPDRGGATVTSSGQKTDGGKRYDVLRVTPPGSLPLDVWLDATTHLPAKTVATIGLFTSTTTFGDYHDVNGVKIPFVQNSSSEGGVVTFTATSATADEPGAAAALARPAMHVDDFSLPSGTTAIPFELVDNHVALRITIDGKGPFNVLFDTGGANIIDTDVAKQLGLGAAGSANSSGVGAATEQVQFATVNALGVGGATLRNQVFAVAPVHAGFGMSSGKPVDGLIGFEVLARFVTTFDYGNNQIVLRTPAAAASAPATGTTVPFVFNGEHVQIPCTIGGFGGACIVDTGSRVALSVDSPFIAQHPSVVPANATAPGANGFGIGGASVGRLGRTTLQIAGFTVPDVIADLSTATKGAFADPFLAGNIGAGFLKRFAVTFDYPHQTMTLAPNAGFAAHETYDRSGTFLITQGGKVVVADVRPGTPAAQAGLTPGDVVTTVGGKDAPALGLAAIREQFRGAAGTVLSLGVASKDGAARTVTLTLRDYV